METPETPFKDVPEYEGYELKTLEDNPLCGLGESPVWHPTFNAFFYVDAPCSKVYKWDPKTNQTDLIRDDTIFTCLTATQKGLILGAPHAIYSLELSTNELTELPYDFQLDKEKAYLNDGKVTPEGKFVIGSMHNAITEQVGVMFSVGYSGDQPKAIADKIIVFNGPHWTQDGKTLRWADSLARTVYTADWNGETGSIENNRVFTKIADGSPDGATADKNGYTYQCIYTSGHLLRINPEGVIESKITFPATNMTSCIFGGEDMRTLFVTSTSSPADPKNPQGKVFTINFNDEAIVGTNHPFCDLQFSLSPLR